jgi:hypothetical protein
MNIVISNKINKFDLLIYKDIHSNGGGVDSVLMWIMYIKFLKIVFVETQFVGENKHNILNVCNNKLKEYEF